MKTKNLLALLLALVLCASLLTPVYALAEGENASIPADPDSYAVIDPAALQKLVEDYAATYNLKKENISVAYCYLDTGDTWYYNGDKWYFSGGLHRVPLMMTLAEWEHDGKLTRDSELKGMTLGQAEESILIYNSNENTHAMMNMLGSNQECRKMFQKYSSLPEDYYNTDFLEYGHFTARFMMDVLKTLYYENDRFPNILECMKRAAVGQYFGAGLGNIEVAQRFGSYNNPEVNHDAGIIYTQHPFALVVMTRNMGMTQQIAKDMGILFRDYTLSLDGAYDTWIQQKDPAVTAPETQSEPVETPTEGETPAEQQAGETPDTGLILPGNPAETETEPDGEQTPAAVTLTPQQQEIRDALEVQNARRMVVLVLSAVLLFVFALALVLQKVMRRRKIQERDEE